MSETNRVRSAATRLAQRLGAAARSAASARPAAIGRCAVPVAVDPWGAVSERCPLRPLHDGEHEIESADAQRERLDLAAAIDPARVLGAVDVVEDWLARANGPGEAVPPAPVRDLWMVVDVAGARAALDAVDTRPLPRGGEVATDG